MALHIAARLHAFLHGAMKSKDDVETRALYDEISRLFKHHGLGDQASRANLAQALGEDVVASFDLPSGHPQAIFVTALIEDMFDYENLFVLPHIEWSRKRSVAEHWALREGLEEQRRNIEDFEATCMVLRRTVVACLDPVYSVCQSLAEIDATVYDLTFSATLIENFLDPGEVVEAMIAAFFDEAVERAHLFLRHRTRLNGNLIAASGGNPELPQDFNRTLKPPSASPKDDPAELVSTYLGGTPLHTFLRQDIAFTIPEESRFEHCHIIGGTGHGKTQMLQQLVLHDLNSAQTETASIVVIDSQGDLIRKLSTLKLFDPSAPGSLAGRFLLIDPSDIDHPPALNLFDPGIGRLENYTPHQQELAFNSLVDIYGRFFGALLGSELTARQGAVFRYLARLMLTIEGATIHTLIELMDDVSPFKGHIEKLDSTARRFFEKEFARKTFNATRQQIKHRLYAVLSIPTFDRLFSAPRSKIDFFDVLNEGTIILVNTAKDLLKTDGTEIFGRFVLSLIEHAIMERATLPEKDRTPTYLYVDEAQDYFDETIESLLVQGRKFNFGLVLAHQNLAQLNPRLRAVIMGNTTIKLAGGVSDSDARALAPDMRTTPDNLLSMKKRDDVSEFALSVRNLTPHALKVSVPFGFLENDPVLDPEQQAALLSCNRDRVGYVPEVPPSEQPTATPELPSADEVDTHVENHRHVGVQRNLAEQARNRGFGVEIEYAMADGKRIDLALFGHHLNIAVEVSVTNREAYELSNIQKALDADFDQVWMIADDPNHREKIAAHVRQSLSPDAIARVAFGSFDDAKTWLTRFIAPSGKQSTVVGYEVETIFMPPDSLGDHGYRQEQLRYLLSSR